MRAAGRVEGAGFAVYLEYLAVDVAAVRTQHVGAFREVELPRRHGDVTRRSGVDGGGGGGLDRVGVVHPPAHSCAGGVVPVACGVAVAVGGFWCSQPPDFAAEEPFDSHSTSASSSRICLAFLRAR